MTTLPVWLGALLRLFVQPCVWWCWWEPGGRQGRRSLSVMCIQATLQGWWVMWLRAPVIKHTAPAGWLPRRLFLVILRRCKSRGGPPSVGCTAHTAPTIWAHLQSLPSVNYLKICCDPHGIVSAVWNRRLALKELWARIKYFHLLQQLLPSSYLFPQTSVFFLNTVYERTA